MDPEKVMEDKLIHQLTCGESQWTLREDIKNEEALWNNLRMHLNRINVRVLEGKAITDREMDSIRNYIEDEGSSPYKAAQWLAGEHGVAQIPLERDDLSRISLIAINNSNIAGGISSYEVIHQYYSRKTDAADQNRRFDVTLLINGLPLIHIELKKPSTSFYKAFNQIVKYSRENKFKGIFGLIQMFVVTNGSDSRYFAAAKYNEFNRNFLTSWVDTDNKPQNNYLDFAREVLNVPRAHEIVGLYSVLDAVRKRIILLRPYQIHAIEKVKEASRNLSSGYIWHTTGSGKTLTSFNVTRNLLSIPTINKVLFLIDRRDLDKQTTDSFSAYAANTSTVIDNTSSTKELRDKLKHKDREVIITTVQKMQNLLHWCSKEETAPDGSAPAPDSKEDRINKSRAKFKEHLKNLQVAFVVDECHRAVSAQTQKLIERFFDKPARPSLWYGFTGTPLFAENKSTAKGALPRITEQQYGPCLHSYTIKEAIKDHAVLGFHITYLGFSREHLLQFAGKYLQEQDYASCSDLELEQAVEKQFALRHGHSIYSNREHKKKVVEYLFTKCHTRLRLSQAQSGNAYEAMLTCESIQDAQEYYEIIQEFKAQDKLPPDLKRMAPDFPKTAITYTVGENEDGAEVNRDKMKQSLADYNQMFGTSFSLESINEYNRNLTDRLARKTSSYSSRLDQLDLVIVVDRLLTGFDAPCLALLIVDRPPMKPQNLIQAMSRTNRLFDDDKTSGFIVTMQSKNQFARKIDDALVLYSRGGTNDVAAPIYAKVREQLIEAINHLIQTAPDPEAVDLSAAEENKEKLVGYVKAVQKVDSLLAAIKTYDEYLDLDQGDKDGKDDKLVQEFGVNPEKLLESHMGKYNNARDIIKQNPPEYLPDPVDIDYALSSIKEIQVSYEYLIKLIERYFSEHEAHGTADSAADRKQAAAAAARQQVEELIGRINSSNPKMGAIIRNIWQQALATPQHYKDKDIGSLIADQAHQEIAAREEAFAKTWCIDKEAIRYLAQSGKSVDEVDQKFDFAAYQRNGGTLNKLKARQQMRADLKELLKNEIIPLMQQSLY